MLLSKLSGSGKWTTTLVSKISFVESFNGKIAKEFESFITWSFPAIIWNESTREKMTHVWLSGMAWETEEAARHTDELFHVRVLWELPPFYERKMTEIGGKNPYFCRFFAHNRPKKCSNHKIFFDNSYECFPENGNSEIGPEMPILPFHIKLTSP